MLPASVLSFIHGFSYIFKNNNADWHSVLCPFCDDAIRKPGRLDHGHFYISNKFNYCHCFRCSYANSLSRALISLGFNDAEGLALLTKNNSDNFLYYSNKLNISDDVQIGMDIKLDSIYIKFQTEHPAEFNTYIEYIYSRCFNINPLNFLLSPYINDGYLMVRFYNLKGQVVTNRYITPHAKLRYLIPSNAIKPYYYFQNINEIDTYTNINICEGAFDIINISKYFKGFNIAIGGKQFNKILKELLTGYLLIGNYTFNIFFDNDNGQVPIKIMKLCTTTVQQLNPHSKINFYMPSLSKDVSDLFNLEKL